MMQGLEAAQTINSILHFATHNKHQKLKLLNYYNKNDNEWVII